MKVDPALTTQIIESSDVYKQNSSRLTELLELAKTFNFADLHSSLTSVQEAIKKQDSSFHDWVLSQQNQAWIFGSRLTTLETSQSLLQNQVYVIQQDTASIKAMMTEIFSGIQRPVCYALRVTTINTCYYSYSSKC